MFEDEKDIFGKTDEGAVDKADGDVTADAANNEEMAGNTDSEAIAESADNEIMAGNTENEVEVGSVADEVVKENPDNDTANDNTANDNMANDNTANEDSYYYNVEKNNNQPSDEGSYYNYYSSNQGMNYSRPPENPNKKKNTTAVVVAFVVAAIVLVLGLSLIAANVVKNADSGFGDKEKVEVENKEDKENKGESEYPTIGSTVTDKENNASSTTGGVIITDVSDVVQDVMPSIVSITSTTIVESYNYNDLWPFFGYGEDEKEYEEQVGAGSGIVVKQTDSELLIVTNNHVIAGADSLSIQFVNGTSIEGVTKSTDEEADIAIVSIKLSDIDSDTMKAIKVAALGSSDDIMVGEGVVAIGNALGYGQSVTTGVISAKEREIAVDNKTMTVLQTDAAINGGNSGGALLNARGEVIGINVAKYSSSSYGGSASVEGMGFAIPISQATEIINTLMSRETREKVAEEERGALGILAVAVDSSATEMYSIPQGIYIKEITEGGGADKAGLRATDIITKFDGQNVTTMQTLQDKLQYYKVGEKVKLTIMRNTDSGYKEREVEVTLSKAATAEEKESR